MTFQRRLTAIAVWLLAPAALAATPPSPQPGNQWSVDMPRQNWATTEGLVDLRPLKPISPASVADRMMIADVFAHWGMAYDEGRLDVVRSLFTEDGVLEGAAGSRKPGATQMMRYVGRDAIAKAVQQERAQQADQRRHAMTNVVIEQLTANTATAYAYAVVTAAGNSELYLGASAIYRAELKKETDGCWRLKRFVIGIDSYRRLVSRAGK